MSLTTLEVIWSPGPPPVGRFTVTLDRSADTWIFRELADVVEPAPWMVDIRSAYLEMSLQVQAALRNPQGEVVVYFEVSYNQQTPLLCVAQTVPSKMITDLRPVPVSECLPPPLVEG